MEFSLDLVIYLVGLAATAGTILARITSLEKKVDKHNNMVERTYKLESDMKTMFKRMDELRIDTKEELNKLEHEIKEEV